MTEPYVVLLGDVGCGKSTIVDKITGESSRAANFGASATRRSDPVWAPGGEFVIADTPGSNSMGDKFGHNIWIATAFNFRPVSKVLITVNAEGGRMDGVISSIREYSDRFADLPDVPLGVLITHMDKVSWPASDEGHEADFRRVIRDELDIEDVVFSSTVTTGQMLTTNILSICNEPINLKVSQTNFLRIFKNLHKGRPREFLQLSGVEVEDFKKKREEFNTKRGRFLGRKQVDLVFEFQAYMTKEVTKAQIRLSDVCRFTFEGTEADNEVAHVGNMTNQMLSELRSIRVETLAHQDSHGADTLRKCPHCGQVWTKVEGCDDETYCGTRPSTQNDLNAKFSTMATFSFRWDECSKKLEIRETGTRPSLADYEDSANEDSEDEDTYIHASTSSEEPSHNPYGGGCGREVTWNQMAPVAIPPEFSPTEATVATSDVLMLPPFPAASKPRGPGCCCFCQMTSASRPGRPGSRLFPPVPPLV